MSTPEFERWEVSMTSQGRYFVVAPTRVNSFVVSTPSQEDAKQIAADHNLVPELVAALEEILYYTGGAENALEDEYVMDRAQAALNKAKR